MRKEVRSEIIWKASVIIAKECAKWPPISSATMKRRVKTDIVISTTSSRRELLGRWWWCCFCCSCSCEEGVLSVSQHLRQGDLSFVVTAIVAVPVGEGKTLFILGVLMVAIGVM